MGVRGRMRWQREQHREAKRNIGAYYTHIHKRLLADFEAAGNFGHPTMTGNSRESNIRDFVDRYTPDRFGVTEGKLVDLNGQTSDQLDLIVYDKWSAVPILDLKGGCILPVEAALVIVEVKSRFTSDKAEACLSNAASVFRLRPGASAWVSRRSQGQAAMPGEYRLLYSILAYTSSASPGGWPKTEFNWLMHEKHAKYRAKGIIDNLYILDRGVVNLSEEKYLFGGDPSSSLVLWYQSLLGFLSREAARRHPIKWSDYFPSAASKKIT